MNNADGVGSGLGDYAALHVRRLRVVRGVVSLGVGIYCVIGYTP